MFEKDGQTFLDWAEKNIRAIDGDNAIVGYTVRLKPVGEGAPPMFVDQDGDEQTHLHLQWQEFFTTEKEAAAHLKEVIGDEWANTHEICAVGFYVKIQSL